MPIVIDSTAVICAGAVLSGDVRIDAGVIIHPCAELKGERATVTVKQNSIIEERAVLHADTEPVEIGQETLIEVGALIRSARIGDNTVVEAKACVDTGAVIGSGCSVAALVTVGPGEKIEDCTVVYRAGSSKDNHYARRPQLASKQQANVRKLRDSLLADDSPCQLKKHTRMQGH